MTSYTNDTLPSVTYRTSRVTALEIEAAQSPRGCLVSSGAPLLRRIMFFHLATGLGQKETPNHVSDGGSFRRKRPW
jgi:hypothetical protein